MPLSEIFSPAARMQYSTSSPFMKNGIGSPCSFTEETGMQQYHQP